MNSLLKIRKPEIKTTLGETQPPLPWGLVFWLSFVYIIIIIIIIITFIYTRVNIRLRYKFN